MRKSFAILILKRRSVASSEVTINELGCRIPDDVSVVGYDDLEIAQHLHPPLTTILLPHYEMGTAAVELLLEFLSTNGKAVPQLKVECPLVARQSAGPSGEKPLTAGRSI